MAMWLRASTMYFLKSSFNAALLADI
jgi:hypothetical protein